MEIHIKKKIRNYIPPRVIFATAQLALAVFLTLSVFEVPRTDFLQGLLCGYALVGNIFWLVRFSKEQKQ